jgi:putative ABC transport system substrate-binding protein
VRPDAVLVPPSWLTVHQSALLADLTLRQHLPGMFGSREIAEVGGLMSYAADFHDQFRRCAGYVDKILKGANPAELPVEQASKYELVVNLKTAKALGITIPPEILVRADEVIE